MNRIERECTLCGSAFDVITNEEGIPLTGDYRFRNLPNLTVWFCAECA